MGEPKHSVERVWEIADSISNCYLITQKGAHARPMSAIVREDAGTIYFLTDLKSVKDDEIAADPRVTLTFASSNTFLVVYGRAAISRDRALVKEL